MKAVVRKDNNMVVCVGDTVEFDKHLVSPIVAYDLTANNSYVVENAELPLFFIGGIFQYVEGVFVNTNETLYEELKRQASTPQSITPRQFRLQLLALGLLDEVEAMAATDKATQIWFEYSLDFQRNHEMLIASATALGLSDEAMDNFFIEASKL